MSWRTEWTALTTIIIHESRRAFRIWPQTLLPAVVTTSLYFLIFGKVIGARIGDIAGFSYIQYIAPGLIMMQIITSAYTGAVSGFLWPNFSAKFKNC